MKTAQRKASDLGRVAIALLVAFSFVHGDCSGLLQPPPPSQTGASAVPDPIQADSVGLIYGCQSPGADTPAEQWVFNWSNNTNTIGYEYWPKGGVYNPATLTLWDDPRNQSETFNAIQQAAQFWQSQLNTGNPGTMLLNLAVDTNIADQNSSPVDAYDSDDEGDAGGTISPLESGLGGSNTLTYQTSGMQLVGAAILLQVGFGPQQTYENALHEIGHALGLDHSPYQGSVMFPLSSYCISTSSTSMSVQDRNYLWKAYDPRWHPKQCVIDGDCPPVGKGPILQAVRRRTMFSGSEAYVVPRGHRAPPNLSSIATTLTRFYAQSAIPGHPNAHWHMIEDNDHQDFLRTDSLWLSSSLVSQIRVLGNIQKRPGDFYTTVLKLARISRVFKHLYSPDAQVKAGDLIVIADHELPQQSEMLDDLTLHRSDGDVMVFLRRSGTTTMYDGRSMPIYVTTSLFNSKFTVETGGILKPLSIRATAVDRDINKRTLTSALLEFKEGIQVPKNLAIGSIDPAFNEMDAVKGLLTRNGIITRTQILDYEREMYSNPQFIYETRAAEDERLAGFRGIQLR